METLKLAGKGTFSGGVHPPDRKELSADAPIEVIPQPKEVIIPLQQHVGAPCKPTVSPKQEVGYGELIGESKAFISAKLHSPISGVVQQPVMTTLPNGRHMSAIRIKAVGRQFSVDTMRKEFLGGRWPKDVIGLDPDDVTRDINDAGIVGLGGAAFPTHIKITPYDRKIVDTLLVNGCECEPYLTADDRLMRDIPDTVISGALLAGFALGADDIIVGIEANKPEAIEAMRHSTEGTRIRIAVLPTRYPQGSEKHLIKAVIGRIIPLGGLPADVKVSVSNVATMAAVARAVLRKMPLTHRPVSVTGAGIVTPKNLLAPFGITYRAMIDFCGGLTEDAVRIISGGPMMGFSFTDLDMPLTKGTGGITVLTSDDVNGEDRTACLKCGRCVDVCPMGLVPARLAVASRFGDLMMARRYSISACIECGCCAYVCPAAIPLVQLIRTGKARVAAAAKK